jgi:hypothetical protein
MEGERETETERESEKEREGGLFNPSCGKFMLALIFGYYNGLGGGRPSLKPNLYSLHIDSLDTLWEDDSIWHLRQAGDLRGLYFR